MSIYQARFNRYLEDRGLKKPSGSKVWAFLGDGETDEPESLGAISLAAREKLDNLIFVINCNLQRLDGPVRGNGQIIQELEAIFRGAGWNVIKVIWGSDWDPLLADRPGRPARQADGGDRRRPVPEVRGRRRRLHARAFLRRRSAAARDGQAPVGRTAEEAAARRPRSREGLQRLQGGASNTTGQPTVILARTIKGYGLGEAGEGKNITHQQKKMNEADLRVFRTRFGIPISDEEIADAPFYRPPDDSPELQYLRERRKALGGYVPSRIGPRRTAATRRSNRCSRSSTRAPKGARRRRRWCSCGCCRSCCATRRSASSIVPIIPDEARTFGMESLFRAIGIYSHVGQKYEPVDMDTLLYYKEAQDGQILEEGITEAGSMSSFIAAGTAYATHGVNTIPFFIYYSMFGFQRVGRPDLGRCRLARPRIPRSAPPPAGRRSRAKGCSTRTATATSTRWRRPTASPTIRRTPTSWPSSSRTASAGCIASRRASSIT